MGLTGFGKHLYTALPSDWGIFIRHSTALLECMDPAKAQHCAEANQPLNLETLLRATWGLQGQQM